MKAWRDFGIIGSVASIIGCIALLGPSLLQMRISIHVPNTLVFERNHKNTTPGPQAAALVTAVETPEATTTMLVTEAPTVDRATSSRVVLDTMSTTSAQEKIIVPVPVVEAVLTLENDTLLMLHNKARAAHGVAPLSWSPVLEKSATAWADTLASRGCTLAHSGKTYGENIYYSRKYGAGQTPRKPAEIMDSFLAEETFYDHATNACVTGEVCGHYTQIMWANTTEVGCAKSLCLSDERKEIWVCHYSPKGNIEGLSPY